MPQPLPNAFGGTWEGGWWGAGGAGSDVVMIHTDYYYVVLFSMAAKKAHNIFHLKESLNPGFVFYLKAVWGEGE